MPKRKVIPRTEGGARKVVRHGTGTPVITMPQAVFDRAVEVLGDRSTAFRWLGTPIPALGFQTPIAVAATDRGEQAVLDVLGQIDHGVF